MIKIYRNVAKLKDMDMFYLDSKTEGIPIVCIHGLWGRAETWADFINNYGNKYRIIAPDLRGHGFSSKPESGYTFEEMSEDIKGLLDYLKLDSIILVGHSIGGAIAGHLAAAHPENIKALAMLDESASEVNSTKSLIDDKNRRLDPITNDWPLPFSTLKEAQEFIKRRSSSELEYEYFMRSLREYEDGYNMMYSQKAVADILFNKHDWYKILPEIKCLTMLVRAASHKGINDEDFTKMKNAIKNCISYEMSDPDHNVHLANKKEFYEYFDEFLSRI